MDFKLKLNVKVTFNLNINSSFNFNFNLRLQPGHHAARSRCVNSALFSISYELKKHIQDGDAADSSSWTCSSGEACEITYDLQTVESLEQLRIGEIRNLSEEFVCITINRRTRKQHNSVRHPAFHMGDRIKPSTKKVTLNLKEKNRRPTFFF